MDRDGPPVGPVTGAPPPASASRGKHYGIPAVGAMALVVMCGICFASAASVSVTTGSLAAAQIAVPRCSAAGVAVFEVVSGGGAGVVSSVVLNNLPSACGGGTVNLTVNSGGGSTVSTTGTVPVGGGLLVLTLTPTPTLVVGNQVDLVVTGP